MIKPSNYAPPLSRRRFLKAASGLFLPQQPQPPNIVFILADDLGYRDLGCYGGKIPTPNIDALAYGGMRFTCHESAAPVCTASRASLLTGKYVQRFSIRQLNFVLLPEDQVGLPAVATIADRLRVEGINYHTGHVGKWHLGHFSPDGNYRNSEYHPTNRGFNYSEGLPFSGDMDPFWYDNGVWVEALPDSERKNLTGRITQGGLNFIRQAQNQNNPFCLYLAYTAPHIPVQPSDEFKGISGLGRYGDVIMELDNAVGQIVQALGPNTVVFFTSDNGGDPGLPEDQRGTNVDFNRKPGKYSTHEGGTRMPFICYGPGIIPAGQTCDELTSALDICPTLCSIAGFPETHPNRGNSDGVDLWPLLKGEAAEVAREKPLIYFNNRGSECAAIRLCVPDKPTALLKFRFVGGSLPEVYNIATGADSEELINIAYQLPPDLIGRVREDVRQQLSGFPADNINLELV